MTNPKFTSNASSVTNKARYVPKESVYHKYSEANKHLL